jgi:hypothetical protein
MAARSVETKLKFYREQPRAFDNMAYVARVNQKKRREHKRAQHKRDALAENFFTCGSLEALDDHKDQWLEDSSQKRYDAYVKHKEVAVAKYKVTREANADARRAKRRSIQRDIDRQKSWLEYCMLAVHTAWWQKKLLKQRVLNKSKKQMHVVCRNLRRHKEKLAKLVRDWRVRVAKKLDMRKQTDLLLLFLRQYTAGTKSGSKKFALTILKFRRMKRKIVVCQQRWRERMKMREARMEVLNLRFLQVEQVIWAKYELKLIRQAAEKAEAAEAAEGGGGGDAAAQVTQEKELGKLKKSKTKRKMAKSKTKRKMTKSKQKLILANIKPRMDVREVFFVTPAKRKMALLDVCRSLERGYVDRYFVFRGEYWGSFIEALRHEHSDLTRKEARKLAVSMRKKGYYVPFLLKMGLIKMCDIPRCSAMHAPLEQLVAEVRDPYWAAVQEDDSIEYTYEPAIPDVPPADENGEDMPSESGGLALPDIGVSVSTSIGRVSYAEVNIMENESFNASIKTAMGMAPNEDEEDELGFSLPAI